MKKPLLPALALSLAGALSAAPASAFCGFYVSGADASLYNNATEVVLMRDGVRTVLSMENNYQGPPQDFALVVPVPVVLQKENVKTLPAKVFERVDHLAAPRLVEYWEQDPCRPPMPMEVMAAAPTEMVEGESDSAPPRHYGVKIEAKFSVGEYDILILSASDSMGLDAFLRHAGYKIPAGAEPYLRPYVTNGSKFFVAKVNVGKVHFENGQAMLSPLRFHYDSESFSLPVRLGLINAGGAQDLIIHILARARHEVANYANIAIPTNLDVGESVKGSFATFYAALFDRTLALHPHAVVTEYSWDAGSCDPCPEPPLEPSELATLGADALPAVQDAVRSGEVPPDFASNLTLTRLHVRYGKDSLGEDLVFRAAPPIEGGRGVPGPKGELPHGVQSTGSNNFQGRYVIRHPWTGPVTCDQPQRGIWGGPPEPSTGTTLKVATNTAFAPRGANLASFLAGPAPELDGPGNPLPGGPFQAPSWPDIPVTRGGGCAGCSLADPEGALPTGILSLAALAAALGRRSRRAASRRR
ncbi:MAG: DUF2330 domain-containing protein [Byssovorax sp.]